jgi:hypothetical protein
MEQGYWEKALVLKPQGLKARQTSSEYMELPVFVVPGSGGATAEARPGGREGAKPF